MVSTLEQLILTYPSVSWDWTALSCNPAVSFDFILHHPELQWKPRYVSRNRNVLEQDVRNHLDYPWDFESLCANPNMSMTFYNEFIIKPEEQMRVDWHLLSANAAISMVDVINNPLCKWDDRYLSANPNISSNFILNEGRQRNWFIPSVCANKGITDRDIFRSTLKQLFEWDYRNLSANPNLSMKYVNDNLEHGWNFHTVSTHASLTDIQTFHQINWDAHGLSMNTNITFEYVLTHPSLNWHPPSLLVNDAIDLRTIVDNVKWFRDRGIETTLTTYLSSNGTITEEWVKQNFRAIDWTRLSRNTFKH